MLGAVVMLTASVVLGGNLPVRHVALSTAGALEVFSEQPGAWVKLDGELFGRTPLKVAGLEPGPHRLEVGVKSQQLLSRQVEIPRGQTVQVAVPSARERALGQLAAWLPAGAGWKMLLGQPWAYAAAAATGLSVVGAGVLWTSTPERLPLVGRLPMDVSDTQWMVARVVSLGLVGMLALVTVVMFVVPGIPALAALAAGDGAAAAAADTPPAN